MLQASFFKNKRVTVFGLGVNMGGVGTVKFLVDAGVREIIVTDMKSASELEASLQELAEYKNVTYILGKHRPEDFTHTDMVIKNPVIPWTNEFVLLAEKNGVPVEMDSSIFFALSQAPIIGVTGTKGKTTTTTLIAHILEQAKKSVVRVGIGQTGVLGVLEEVTPDSVVVFELSSWRLSALAHIKKSPSIAVLLNIYPDHLNYYETMEAYAADKKNILSFQKSKDVLVANFDNETVRALAQDTPGEIAWFTEGSAIDGDGVWIKDEQIWTRRQGKEDALLPLADIPLPGKHNIANVLAAVGAVLAFGLTREQIVSGIVSFPGVKHRLELVREKNGVRYYNDTAATIPESAIAALRTFSEPVILIAGGSDKRLEFGLLAKEILERSLPIQVILFKGEGTEKLLQAMKDLEGEEKERSIEVVESMGHAVALASERVKSGDVVLLSPGAASFGIFKNEFDRGEQFCKAVRAL